MRIEADLSESLEDYLEAIYRIETDDREVRVTELAEVLGVKKPSVTVAMQALSKRGLVLYEPYGTIRLTADGARAAASVAVKHRFLEHFFSGVLGLDRRVSSDAACRIEHVLPGEAYQRLAQFIKYVYARQGVDGAWINDFRSFMKKNPVEAIERGALDAYFEGVSFEL